ncbi:MAG: hypothetical protein WCJ95_22220 [Mariniphaga sp.]
MNDNKEITGFSEWIIPSGEGVVYCEGVPTEAEHEINRKTTLKNRKDWNPSQEALELFRQLVMLQGSWVKIQLWNEFMLWDEIEGDNPFLCKLEQVYVKSMQEKDRSFLQLFVEFRHYKIEDKGYLGGSPIYERYFDPKTEMYTYNCSTFYSVTRN